MNRYDFAYPVWQEISPNEWIDHWSARLDFSDNNEYFSLIAKDGCLSAEDFELMGRWKEGCLKSDHGGWKMGTPRAFEVWMDAKATRPTSPNPDEVADFLKLWSEKTFSAGKKRGTDLRYRFGLSRASTLLHFVSVGEYPIFDSRVATALRRLGSPVEESIVGYLGGLCSAFSDIAKICGVSGVAGLRKLDNALFAYGAEANFPSHQRNA